MIGLIDTKSVKIIYWEMDGAIDPEESDLDRYLQTYDASLLALRGVATEFHCRALKRAKFDEIQAAALSDEKAPRSLRKREVSRARGSADKGTMLLRELFCAGCTEIRNLAEEGDSYRDMRALLDMPDRCLSPDAVIAIGAAIRHLTTAPASEDEADDEGK